MKGRIVPGLLLAVFWVVLLLYGSRAFFSFVVVITVFFAADEYLTIARNGEGENRFAGRFLPALLLLLPVVATPFAPSAATVVLAAVLGFFMLVFWHLRRFGKVTPETAEADYLRFAKDVFGLVYLGVLGAHICLLRALPEGGCWILVATAVTAGSDTGAYFIGRKFGSRRLCPTISPNKTVEGAVGGICIAIVAALFAGYMLLQKPHAFFLVVAATLLSLFGIVGDLTESVIKRGAGVKDSGHCLAGHGGILDRIDSLLFVVPSLYYLLVFSGYR